MPSVSLPVHSLEGIFSACDEGETGINGIDDTCVSGSGESGCSNALGCGCGPCCGGFQFIIFLCRIKDRMSLCTLSFAKICLKNFVCVDGNKHISVQQRLLKKL